MNNGSTKINPTARAEENYDIVGYAVLRCRENPAFIRKRRKKNMGSGTRGQKKLELGTSA